MNFAQKLIQLRKQHGMSQEDLANKLGVSRQAVSRWEQSNSYPDLPNLQGLCRVFSISADYLICDEVVQPCSAEQPEPKDTQERPHRFNFHETRFLIIACIWLFAAFCFLVVAIDTLNVVFLGLVLADLLLAGLNLFFHFRQQSRK